MGGEIKALRPKWMTAFGLRRIIFFGETRKYTSERQKRTGRKPYKPIRPVRELAMTLVAAGMTLPEIAAVLEISRSGLCEHYRVELATGRARRRAETIEQLRKAMKAGNVSAMKSLLDLFGFPIRGGRLGVKAQRALAAQIAGHNSEWITEEYGNDLEPPPLAIKDDDLLGAPN